MTDRLSYLINTEKEFLGKYRDKICEGGLNNKEYEDLEFLLEHIANEGMKIIEIGCYSGFCTALFSTFAKENKGKVYAIDNFKGSPDALALINDHKNNNVKDILEKNLNNINTRNFVEILEGQSIDMVDKFKDNSIDFIFIDGDHRYEATKNDIEKWTPKVKVGGIICGHDCEIIIKDSIKDLYEKFDGQDYTGLHLGVVRAVSEYPNTKMFNNNYNRFEPERIWYIQK